VIALDTNILVYAHRADSDQHERARVTLEGLVRRGLRFGIPWPCVHEFMAITTHPRVYDPPSTPDQAVGAISSLLELPYATPLAEASSHLERLAALICRSDVRGTKVHDARIAVICLSHGVSELWTADRDFSYFPDLTTRNPLID
jgi:toxin-antitoxin system PIN domain toxin